MAVVFCQLRLSWITWCYHMSSTHHAAPVEEKGKIDHLDHLDHLDHAGRGTVAQIWCQSLKCQPPANQICPHLTISDFSPGSNPSLICFLSPIGFNLSESGSQSATFLNVEYLFVPPTLSPMPENEMMRRRQIMTTCDNKVFVHLIGGWWCCGGIWEGEGGWRWVSWHVHEKWPDVSDGRLATPHFA